MKRFTFFSRDGGNPQEDEHRLKQELILIQRSQQGDVDALAQLLKLYDPQLHRLARKVGGWYGLWALTEELVAEGWVGVWCGLARYRPQPNKAPWAYFGNCAKAAMTVYCRDHRGLTDEGRKYYVKVLRYRSAFEQERGRMPTDEELASYSRTPVATIESIMVSLRTGSYHEVVEADGTTYEAQLTADHGLTCGSIPQPGDELEAREYQQELRVKQAAYWEWVLGQVTRIAKTRDESIAWVCIFAQRSVHRVSWSDMASRLQAPDSFTTPWAEFHQRIVITGAIHRSWQRVQGGLPKSYYQKPNSLQKWFNGIYNRLGSIDPGDMPGR